MQSIVKPLNDTLVAEGKTYQDLIFENKFSPLATIPFHHDVEGLDRYFAEGFPYHLAIHHIHPMEQPPEAYTFSHEHTYPELNIIIGKDLCYDITLGDEHYELTGNYSIWIPAGVAHSANVRSGSGYFVAMRFDRQD